MVGAFRVGDVVERTHRTIEGIERGECVVIVDVEPVNAERGRRKFTFMSRSGLTFWFTYTDGHESERWKLVL